MAGKVLPRLVGVVKELSRLDDWETIAFFFYKSSVLGNQPGSICCKMGNEQGRSWGLRRDMPND